MRAFDDRVAFPGMKQTAFGALNSIGSDLLFAGTQFLSRRRWIRTPSHLTSVVGGDGFRYRVHRDWCKASPAELPVKNCHEMVVDSSGRLYLLTDHPRNNVIVFDTDGTVLDSWTLNLKGAHGLSISREARAERLWICDPYSAIVLKTSTEGAVLQQLPRPHALGIYDPWMPYAPTQTAIAPNGDVYVADGYGSQCVLQFNARGEYIRHFGGKGKAESSLDFAHGIAIDNRKGPGKEVLLVTSRRQSCLKQFTLEGQYVGDIALPKGYPCRPVLHGDKLIVSLCWSGAHLRPNSGFVVILDADNKLSATLGGHAEFDGDGRLLHLISDYSVFSHVHDVCADSLGNLYVCQWNAGGTYPIKLSLAS